MDLTTLLRRVEMLRSWRVWTLRIAKIAKELLPGSRVLMVGSVARGDYVGGSDVDVLVISPNAPEKPLEKARVKALIEDRLNLPYYHPFEIHVLRPEEAKTYIERAKGCVVEL